MDEKKKPGRRTKEKATEFLQVYFTPDQKKSVQDYCDQIGVPVSVYLRQLLSEKGVLSFAKKEFKK